jgi:hypothetical protein
MPLLLSLFLPSMSLLGFGGGVPAISTRSEKLALNTNAGTRKHSTNLVLRELQLSFNILATICSLVTTNFRHDSADQIT